MWLSAHLYFDGSVYSRRCDEIILDVVAPFVETCRKRGWSKQFFFIRYSDKGSHIRLRLYGRPGVLERQVRPALEAFVEQHVSERMSLGASRDQRLLHEVRWIDYEPEYERYGATEGMRVAERLFHYSSVASIKILEQIRGKEQAYRLGQGLFSMLLYLFVFCEVQPAVQRWMHDYGTGYLRYLSSDTSFTESVRAAFSNGFDRQANVLGTQVQSIWKGLCHEARLPAPFDQFLVQLRRVEASCKEVLARRCLIVHDKELEEWNHVTAQILPSYVHMMNNRLGIRIIDESYLAHIAAHTLQSVKIR